MIFNLDFGCSTDGVVRLENPKVLDTGMAIPTGSGVILERRHRGDIYVGGRFVTDDMEQTALILLLGPSAYGGSLVSVSVALFLV